MSEAAVPALLSSTESRLIWNLRELPNAPLRTRVLAAIDALVSLAKEPRCADSQADGVPCSSVHANCDDCLRVSGLLDGISVVVSRGGP